MKSVWLQGKISFSCLFMMICLCHICDLIINIYLFVSSSHKPRGWEGNFCTTKVKIHLFCASQLSKRCVTSIPDNTQQPKPAPSTLREKHVKY